MADIKSAREIAMEKLAEIEKPTEEERLKWKFVPDGEKLAARYLKEDVNLLTEVGKVGEKERRYVARGATEVLARNIDLPRNDNAKKINRKAMDGLKLLKKDKAGVENLYSRMRQLFNHYLEQGEAARKQAYEETKVQFAAKLQQAMQQQMGTSARFNIDVERHPQFAEEWRRVQSQLEQRYVDYLVEMRQQLIELE